MISWRYRGSLPVSDIMEVRYPTTATLTNLFEPYALAEWVQPDVAASEDIGLAVCPYQFHKSRTDFRPTLLHAVT